MNDTDRQRLDAAEAALRELTRRLTAMEEGEFHPGGGGFRIGTLRLFEQLSGSLYHLHQRDEAGTESDLTGAKGIWGVPIHATAPTAGYVLVYNASTGEIEWTASSSPGAHVLATTAGLGPAHTTSGLTARQVLRATAATTAAFGAIQDADLPASIARDSELHTRLHAITGTSDHSATNWRVFYSDGSAHVIELALGADGTFLQSEGAAAAPTFGALQTTDIPDISATYQVVSEKDANSGYAGLEADGAVPVAHGGSGETTAQAAIDILTAVSGATNEHVLTKDTATGNAIFKAAAGGGGGASTALDNLASVAINESLISDTDSTDDLGSAAKYWRYIYGDRAYLNATAYFDGGTAGRATLTGTLKTSGTIGIHGSNPSATAGLNCSPAVTGSYLALNLVPTVTFSGNNQTATGVGGQASGVANAARTGLRAYGLNFIASANTSAATATFAEVIGVKAQTQVYAIGAGTLTATKVVSLQAAAPDIAAMIGTAVITEYIGVDVANSASASIATAYGIKVADITTANTANYVAHLGNQFYIDGGGYAVANKTAGVWNMNGTWYRLNRNAGTGAPEWEAI